MPRLFHGETLLQELGVEDEELHGAASLNNLSQAPQAAKHLKVSHRDHLNNLFQVPLATVHLTKVSTGVNNLSASFVVSMSLYLYILMSAFIMRVETGKVERTKLFKHFYDNFTNS